jgi:hypothetical protein
MFFHMFGLWKHNVWWPTMKRPLEKEQTYTGCGKLASFFHIAAQFKKGS